MPFQTKIFFDSSPEELEQKVNSWLAESDADVRHITTDLNSVLETSAGGTVYWTGYSYYTVVYRTPEVPSVED